MSWTPRPPTARTAAILARAGDNTRRTRLMGAERVRLALDWARAHELDPEDQQTRDLVADPRIGVMVLGATGTLLEPCCDAELGIALQVHPLAARALMADAVDLEGRLPLTWEVLQAGEVDLWVARKVATATHDLDPDAATQVDAAVAPLLPSLPTGRLLSVLAARVVEADQVLADTKGAEQRRRRGAWLGRPDPETGLRTLITRGDTATITQLWTRIDHLAHLLREHTDATPGAGIEELRGEALGLLANPLAALTLLVGADHHDHPDVIAATIRDATPAMTRPRAVAGVYLHLTPDTLTGGGITRAEELGAVTRAQLIDLLGHHHVTLKPVIDLAEDTAADAYEIPAPIAERVHLVRPADTFPFSSGLRRTTDLDHAEAFRNHGPPGQTRVSNLAHLGRTAHRTKTHHPGWHLTLHDGRSVWTTPHGYVLLTDARGTHRARPATTATTAYRHVVPDLVWAGAA